MCSKSAFLNFTIFKDIKSQFSKANLGYLGTFLMGMLESKFALNNLNFKCYIQVFFIAFIGHIKSVGTFCPPPPQAFTFGQKCRLLGLNEISSVY